MVRQTYLELMDILTFYRFNQKFGRYELEFLSNVSYLCHWISSEF